MVNSRQLSIATWENLFRAQHTIFQHISHDFDKSALSQQEYDVLLTVVRADGMTAKLRDIVALSLISQPSVSRLIDRMVTRGLVTKAPDPEDGRGSIITATAHGAKQFRQLAMHHANSIVERMAGLTDAELKMLFTLTQKLRDTNSTL